MGAGIPTTATYIILVAVAAPALAQLNIEPLVAHFFVFYYGVLADITPPVALAAYAASGIAKSNPFKTCLLYTSPSPRDRSLSRMPSSA